MNPTNNQPRAVLWDMDGTLIDSMPQHWQAWQEVLQQLDRTVEYDIWNQTAGMRNRELIPLLFPDLPPVEVAYLDHRKEERYRELIKTQHLELLPGVAHWLEQFQALGWKQAVASSAPPENVAVIAQVLHFNGTFQALLSGADVQRGKPDPDIFLAAARRLSVEPQNCLVIEDSPSGVESAHRAGMPAIGVLTTHPRLEANLLVPSMQDLTWEMIENVMRTA